MVISTGFKIQYSSQALVAHAYNPSYSGVRDQEAHSSKPALSPKESQKRAGGVSLSSNPSTTKKKKEKILYSFLYRKYINHIYPLNLRDNTELLYL
jgi:hypothetical protein